MNLYYVNRPEYLTTKRETFLVTLLLVFSGNPFLSQFQWLNIICGLGFFIFWVKNSNNRHKSSELFKYLLIILAIFAIQTILLGWNSFPAIVNFCCKLFWGASIYLYLGYRFRYIYFKVITIFALISLICWGLTLVHLIIPGIECPRGSTIIFYTYVTDFFSGEISLRNSGFAWEAGAFGAYLVLTIILFINDIDYLLFIKRRSFMLIILALLTTMSTTSYLALFLVILCFFLLKVKSRWKYVYVGLVVVSSLYVFKEIDFLQSKIDEQTTNAFESRGDFNSTRLGSFLFDLNYIEKHPLFGNGLHSKTRYADHPLLIELWNKGKEAQSGNGFSGIIASMGIVFMLLYFYTLLNENRYSISIGDSIVIVMSLITLLFGEPLLNYPLMLGLPFIKYSKIKY